MFPRRRLSNARGLPIKVRSGTERSGIDPPTIDQTEMMERSSQEYETPLYAGVLQKFNSVVQDATGAQVRRSKAKVIGEVRK
jgi:hypothetical protein